MTGKKPERRQLPAALKKQIEAGIRESYTESNDNTWVDSPLTYKKKNPHLLRKAEEGAKQHAAWEKEHPNLTAWGNVAGAIPFAVASVPLSAGIVAGGDALAATTAGQVVTAGMAPLYQTATGATIADAPALTWADAGLTSAFGAHGISQVIEDGNISPMTALEMAPLGRLAKPITKSIKFRSFTNNTPAAQWDESKVTQRSIGNGGASSSSIESTIDAAIRGRDKLLNWIKDPFYKQRIEEEPMFRYANDIVNDAEGIIKNVNPKFDKTLLEIDPTGQTYGITTTRPAKKLLNLGDYNVYDTNTGLDVNIASDIGAKAEDVTLHELLHYLTVNSKGIPEFTATMQVVDNGWMKPLDYMFGTVGKNIGRGNKWQNYILDQNDALLPKYDAVVEMVMKRPNEAKAALMKVGRSEAEAQSAVDALKNRYSYWADIQEQRAHLQELFISKIRPHLKNPNDAAEIETFLTEHPEILEKFSPYKYIQEVRPGSLKQYASYFASALSTLPFINKLTTE